MYAEGDIIYANDWNGFMDTMVSTLVYTNSDFYFSARHGAYLHRTGISKASGMQLMAKGSLYSYEDDDTNPRVTGELSANPTLIYFALVMKE